MPGITQLEMLTWIGLLGIGSTIETVKAKFCFCNISAQRLQNFKILVPTPPYTLSMMGGRDKNVKILIMSS